MLDWRCAGNIILQRALGYVAGLMAAISGPSASLRATLAWTGDGLRTMNEIYSAVAPMIRSVGSASAARLAMPLTGHLAIYFAGWQEGQ